MTQSGGEESEVGQESDIEQDDPLDEDLWQRICVILSAAHGGDVAGYRSEFLSWRDEVPLPRQQRAGLYLWYLLQYRIVDIVGRRPTPKELHQIVRKSHPRLCRVVSAKKTLFEDVLRKVFEYPPLKAEVEPAQLAILGSAVLGVLLLNPAADLEAAKPHLAEWWRHHVKSFLQQGLNALC